MKIKTDLLLCLWLKAGQFGSYGCDYLLLQVDWNCIWTVCPWTSHRLFVEERISSGFFFFLYYKCKMEDASENIPMLQKKKILIFLPILFKQHFANTLHPDQQPSPLIRQKKKGGGRKRWSKMCPEEPNMLFQMMWLRHAKCSQLVGTWRWCRVCVSLLLTPELTWKSFHLLLDLTEAWNIANQCVLRHSNMPWSLHYISFWWSWSVAVFCH